MKRSGLISLLGATLLSATALAGGFANLDVGTHRCGMMAVVATGEDPTMIYHNPANMLEIEEDEALFASINSVLVKTDIRIRYPDDSLSENLEPTKYYGFVPFLGYTSDFGLERFKGGLALYFPNLYGAAMPRESHTRYLVGEAYFITGYLTPAAAYRLTDWLSFGAGLDLIYVDIELQRAFNLALFREPVDFRNCDPDSDFWFTLTGDDEVLSWHAGLTAEPIDGLRLSAVYYEKAEITPEGEVDVDVPEQYGQDFTTFAEVGMLIPAAWRFGVSYELGERWTFGFDYNWWRYSDYEYQEIKTGLADELGIDLDLSSDKNYTNSKNIGLGLQYRLNERWSLLAGWQQDWSPAPNRTYSLDNPNLSFIGYALGAKYELGRRLRAEISYDLNNYERINVRNSETFPPTNGTGDGLWHAVGLSLLYRL